MKSSPQRCFREQANASLWNEWVILDHWEGLAKHQSSWFTSQVWLQFEQGKLVCCSEKQNKGIYQAVYRDSESLEIFHGKDFYVMQNPTRDEQWKRRLCLFPWEKAGRLIRALLAYYLSRDPIMTGLTLWPGQDANEGGRKHDLWTLMLNSNLRVPRKRQLSVMAFHCLLDPINENWSQLVNPPWMRRLTCFKHLRDRSLKWKRMSYGVQRLSFEFWLCTKYLWAFQGVPLTSPPAPPLEQNRSHPLSGGWVRMEGGSARRPLLQSAAHTRAWHPSGVLWWPFC